MSRILHANNIKALALDLDGTALGPGSVLTERTKKAVQACRDKGMAIIIATGRAVESAERFRALLDVSGPMIFFNGAVVADMPANNIISTTLLSKEVVDFCIDLSRSTGVYYQVYFPGTTENPAQTLMAEMTGPQYDMYRNHTGLTIVTGDLKEALNKPGLTGCIKSMFLAEPEALEGLRARLLERFGGSIYVAFTLRTFLEVMDAGVSKGIGLRLALRHLGLTGEQAVAMGDEENDLPMFGEAGFSVAPANAKDSVRNAADLVIASNAEDGVAAFLEENFLS
jgi:Cof subfamily protein (haloacid dehalogenase superfamily)